MCDDVIDEARRTIMTYFDDAVVAAELADGRATRIALPELCAAVPEPI